MYKKILIANRGEIACRLARSIREMGIAVATVHSRPDSDAVHVRSIGESVMIGEGPARQSYLNIPAILAAARLVGADAIHPGFGFLSENPEFAAACAGAGLDFIGPRPETLELFGSKAAAKSIAGKLSIPVAAGLKTPSDDVEALMHELKSMAMPFVLKAVSGGGGKGMRVVREAGSLRIGIEGAIREARSAFGDGRLIAEQYLEAPRHIEVQILGDGQGNVIHLYDRECSLQRRHQKVIEEAPVTSISQVQREQLWAWSVALGKSVNYLGLGTVEFAVTTNDIAFLEVNPRLQVEHPVTEMVTGLDLVALQIETVYSGAIPAALNHLPAPQGIAIQARLYAEDADKDFMPSTGRISHFRISSLARCDAGVERGSVISTDYDPMMAKVIAHASDRRQALHRLHAALDDSCILGLIHNRRFLLDLLSDARVLSNQVSTEYIDQWLASQRSSRAASAASPGAQESDLAMIMAAWLLTNKRESPDGWRGLATTGWRPQRPAGQSLATSLFVARGDEKWPVAFGALDPLGQLPVVVNENLFMIKVGNNEARGAKPAWPDGPRAFSGLVSSAGVQHYLRASFSDGQIDAAIGRRQYVLDLTTRFSADGKAFSGPAGMIRAPMMGQVIAVHAKLGDTVEAGQLLATLESMKMELSIKANIAGTVQWVGCSEQGRVQRNQDIFLIKTPEA